MRGVTMLAAATLVAASLVTKPGGAQPAQDAAAGSCLDALGALDRRMEGDGFWLSGYRASHGWTGVATPPGTEPNLGVRAPGLVAGGGAAAAGIAPLRPGGEADADTTSPFARVDWRTAPAQALRTLFAAAQILGQAGREETCRAVLAEAEQGYEGYVAQLRQAGVEPAQIRNWRQKQLALARPLAEGGQGLALESIEGSDLRNPRDEHLGQVADVLVDPRSGEPAWVVIGRGGFLGIGRDHVVVPWQALRITPGFDTFVIDATRRQLDAAPRVDRAALASADGYARQEAAFRRFWDSAATQTGGGR